MMERPLPDGRVPVVVVTGFLGSGKTTLLGRLLGREGYADTAVLRRLAQWPDGDHRSRVVMVIRRMAQPLAWQLAESLRRVLHGESQPAG